MFTSLVHVLLESSSDGGRLALLFIGPVAALVFLGYVLSRYRNADKSYQFESTTRVELSQVSAMDQPSGTLRRTESRYINGHERTRNPRDRVRRA